MVGASAAYARIVRVRVVHAISGRLMFPQGADSDDSWPSVSGSGEPTTFDEVTRHVGALIEDLEAIPTECQEFVLENGQRVKGDHTLCGNDRAPDGNGEQDESPSELTLTLLVRQDKLTVELWRRKMENCETIDAKKKMLEWMLRSIDPDAVAQWTDVREFAPIHELQSKEHAELLLERCVCSDQVRRILGKKRDSSGNHDTVLYTAAKAGNADLGRYLISKGANPFYWTLASKRNLFGWSQQEIDAMQRDPATVRVERQPQ
jgi:hypothetical protein